MQLLLVKFKIICNYNCLFTFPNMVPALLLRRFLQRSRVYLCRRSISTNSSEFNENSGLDSIDDSVKVKKKKMDDFFIDRKVQEILLKITNLDFEKIFRPRTEPLKAPLFKFVTDKQLQELQKQAREKAISKLQMPPVMEIREPVDKVLSYDPELQGYKKHTLLFIDISPNQTDRDRIISVRETDGTLRLANWDERFRMNQTFFPSEGRSHIIPELFDSPHLEKLLDEESYMFVLDKACVQFDPDDPTYHRVVHAVYEHINSNKKFDILRSTRYFGPMSFYFAWNEKIEFLLVDMIEREKIEDAANLIRLLCILHPESKFETENAGPLHIVKDFIEKNVSSAKSALELAIQTYIEIQEKDLKQEVA